MRIRRALISSHCTSPADNRDRHADNECDESPTNTAITGTGTASTTAATTPDSFAADSDDVDATTTDGRTMMPPLQPSQPSNVPPSTIGGGDQQANLIAPKKLHNPCLESADRKNLHRELMFNQKMYDGNGGG